MDTVYTSEQFHDVVLIDFNCIKAFLDKCSADKHLLSFDFETTGNDLNKDTPVGLSLSYDPDTAIYIPINHIDNVGIYPEDLVKLFNEVIIPHFTLIGHNVQFDYCMLRKLGINYPKGILDTMQMVNVLQVKQMALKTLALAFNLLDYGQIQTLEQVLESYFGWTSPDPAKIKTIFDDPDYGTKYHCGKIALGSVKAENYIRYCLNDARLVIRLYNEIQHIRQQKAMAALSQKSMTAESPTEASAMLSGTSVNPFANAVFE